MTTDTETKLPEVGELLLESSLFVSMPISEADRETMVALRDGKIQLDAFCNGCGRPSIFKSYRLPNVGGGAGMRQMARADDWMFKPTSFTTVISCQRCPRNYTYYFRQTAKDLMKVGQYPSMEDILASDLQPYRKLLRPEDFAELRRAGGLISHGIGIGSFVYLRRIFERLIALHYDELKKADKVVDGFWDMRMDDKIQALASVLPPALVKYRKTYAILSKGLHELDEDTCRKHYPVVRAAIIRILEQDLQARQSQEAEAELERQVNDIHGEMKSAAGDQMKAGAKKAG